jgi:hypothetical protein
MEVERRGEGPVDGDSGGGGRHGNGSAFGLGSTCFAILFFEKITQPGKYSTYMRRVLLVFSDLPGPQVGTCVFRTSSNSAEQVANIGCFSLAPARCRAFVSLKNHSGGPVIFAGPFIYSLLSNDSLLYG